MNIATTQQRVEATIGNLIIQVAGLTEQNEKLSAQLAEANQKLAAKDREKEPDGSA